MAVLSILGSASGIPVQGRRHAAVLVRNLSESVLLDSGEGVAQGLVEIGEDGSRIDRVYISHTHADHVAGLPLLLQWMHLTGRVRPLELFCPTDRKEWLSVLLKGMYIIPEKWNFPLLVRSLEECDDTLEIVVASVQNRHVESVRPLIASHGLGATSWSFLVQLEETRIAVTSDIFAVDEIRTLIEDVSLLVTECTHVAPEDIFEIAADNPDLRIVCTHIPPELESRISDLRLDSEVRFAGRVIFAEDGTTMEIPGS